MTDNPREGAAKRIVHPPTNDAPGPSSIISVALGEHEETNWIWTQYPGGRSAVTGYEIVEKKRSPEPLAKGKEAVGTLGGPPSANLCVLRG